MTVRKPSLIGDDIISIHVEDAAEAQAVAALLKQRLGPAEVEVVPALDSVAVYFDLMTDEPDAMLERCTTALTQDRAKVPIGATMLHTIPVRYGGKVGPDLAAICVQLELSEEGFIARHTAKPFVAEAIGFAPGFAYISTEGLPSVSRLKTPRASVPAGAVGFAAGYTGLYALGGPGGWPLIGQTDVKLFDPDADDPFLIRAGHCVQFVVSER